MMLQLLQIASPPASTTSWCGRSMRTQRRHQTEAGDHVEARRGGQRTEGEVAAASVRHCAVTYAGTGTRSLLYQYDFTGYVESDLAKSRRRSLSRTPTNQACPSPVRHCGHS